MCFINPISYSAVLQQLQGQKLYTQVPVDANLAYEFLTLEGGARPMIHVLSGGGER